MFSALKKIPKSHLKEFLSGQVLCIKRGVKLLCVMTWALYFVTAFFSSLVDPLDFKAEEITVWILLITGTALALFLNQRAHTPRAAKFNAYFLTVLLLFLLTKVSVLYADPENFSSVIYLLTFFLVTLVIPWFAGELVAIGILHMAAYTIYYAATHPFLASNPRTFFSGHYADGLIYLATALGMGIWIRSGEASREIENFNLLKDIESKNLQMEKELELATRVHHTLIPKSLRTPKMDITVFYLPLGDIGGDYAKFHFLDENKLIFFISDVTGHGVPAALLVNRLHAEFETAAKEIQEPGLLLKNLNEFITKDFEGTNMYLSAFCGLLDFGKMRMQYSNYGHPPQYLYCLRDSKIRSLDSQTSLLGIASSDAEAVYQGGIPFEKGDTILLYTDGLLETRDSKGQEFGSRRIQDFLRDNHNLSSEDFNKKLLETLTRHKKDHFEDDIFILSIKIH
jgi:serine phosphatase RsbU (regulator of sigma subunit)